MNFSHATGVRQRGCQRTQACKALWGPAPTSSAGSTFQKSFFKIIQFREKLQIFLSKVWVVTCGSSWTGCSHLLTIFTSCLEPGSRICRISKTAEKGTSVALEEGDIGPVGATQETALVKLDKKQKRWKFLHLLWHFHRFCKNGHVNAHDHKT